MLLHDRDSGRLGWDGRGGWQGENAHGRTRPCPFRSWRVEACCSLWGAVVMAVSDWGLCKECQWWQIDPEASITNTTMGLCIEAALQPFRLRVSGNSGCHHHTPGQPTHAAGSSAAPPTAEPQR